MHLKLVGGAAKKPIFTHIYVAKASAKRDFFRGRLSDERLNKQLQQRDSQSHREEKRKGKNFYYLFIINKK